MNKKIQLTPSQIKAYENGATAFLIPIVDLSINDIKNIQYILRIGKEQIVFKPLNEKIKLMPIQIGDKDIFVQEEFYQKNLICKPYYASDFNENRYKDFIGSWQSASKMIKEQSRYSFSECIDIKIIKVQELIGFDLNKLLYEVENTIMEKGISYWKKSVKKRFDELVEYYNQQLIEQNINKTYENNDYVFFIEFKK